jgi:hypothetical protein
VLGGKEGGQGGGKDSWIDVEVVLLWSDMWRDEVGAMLLLWRVLWWLQYYFRYTTLLSPYKTTDYGGSKSM